jgi:hypothetical protein
MIYNTLIQAAVLFGCETWTLTEKSAAFLMSWERKILRRIYGPVCINGTWRIRSTNRVLENLYRRPDIVAEIKFRRIEWREVGYHKKFWMADLRGKEALGDQDQDGWMMI